MIDEPAPLTEEERIALGTGALEKIEEGINDYLRATKDEGDAETLTVAMVLFEASGIDAKDGKLYARTAYLKVTDNPPTHILGVLDVAGERLRESLFACTCGEC